MGESGDRPRFTVLAEGHFGNESSKTAASAVRWLPERVASVIESRYAGRTCAEVLETGAGIPIVATLEEALEGDEPDALLIGIAPQGGALPPEWRSVLLRAIDAGLEIWSGLHFFLADDRELAERARARGVRLVDLRRPPPDLPVGKGRARATAAYRVLSVGTDCNVGKMTATLAVREALRARGLRAGFGATGQTGILIEGRGIAVDAVVSDFVAGAAERLTLEAAEGADVVLVEGQGSLLHPGYSAVTLGLLHGAMPEGMLLCWMPARPKIYGGHYDWVRMPPLDEVARLYETAMEWATPPAPSRVLGLAANTWGMEEAAAREAVERAAELTGLPATDPVRFGADALAEAIVAARETAGA